MKPITRIITSLFATTALVLAEGIPVDRETGKITVEHTVVSLSAEQVEETQALGTFTLTTEQWKNIRTKSPECPKRFENVLPVTSNDCYCGLEGGWVIALSRDRIGVLHSGDSSVCVESVRDGLFKDLRITTLHMNERGEFHLDGMLVPFPVLLKAFATPPDEPKLNEESYLLVELPMDAKPTDAIFESRLKQIAAAADRIGLSHSLFPDEDNE